MNEENAVLTICRKTFPALKASAMKDFIDLLKLYGMYDHRRHNKSDHIYRYGSNEIEFISVDQPQKIRGRKRRHLWINEANELNYEDYKQLILLRRIVTGKQK
jgi:phage terminase large subunit